MFAVVIDANYGFLKFSCSFPDDASVIITLITICVKRMGRLFRFLEMLSWYCGLLSGILYRFHDDFPAYEKR